MKKYTIDFNAWVTIEANDTQDAFAKAQGLISDVEFLIDNHLTLEEPFEMVVADDGVEEHV